MEKEDVSLKSKKEFFANKYRGWLWKVEKREGEITYNSNKIAIHLENEVINTSLTKTKAFEIITLKYVFPLIIIFSFFSFNLFHPSMLGLSSAILLFIGAEYLYKKFNLQTASVFLIILPLCYFIFRFGFPNINAAYSITTIFNYTFQYLIFIFLMKKIILDFLNKKYKNIYRTDVYLFQYIIFEKKKSEEQINLENKNLKYFNYFLIGLMTITFLLGGTLLGGKIAKNINTEKIIKKQELEIKKHENIAKNEDLIKKLDAKALEFNLPKDKQAHLTDKNVIDYQLIYIFKNQVFVDVETGNRITYPNERTSIVSHIKNNKFYIFANGREYYIDGEKAK